MNKEIKDIKNSEYDALMSCEPENHVKIAHVSAELDNFERNDAHEAAPRSPTHSEDPFHVKIRQNAISKRPLLRIIGQGTFAVVERSIVLAGFSQLLIGVVTYSGKGISFNVSLNSL